MGKKKKVYENFQKLLALHEKHWDFICMWLHITLTDWRIMIEHIKNGRAYISSRIPKNFADDKVIEWRPIDEPIDELKLVQEKILTHFLMQIPIHFSAYGARKGDSIIANARAHLDFARTIFNIDLKSAFPSVRRKRVLANLKKPFLFHLKQYGIEFSQEDSESMLEALVDLVIYNDCLPQGAPTSPMLLNIVCTKLDQEITRYLESISKALINFRYTRYFDDLSISSTEEISEEVRNKIKEIVKNSGFRLKYAKERYLSPTTGKALEITGLILSDNRITYVPQRIQNMRARLHSFSMQDEWSKNETCIIRGMLGFLTQVYKNSDKFPSAIKKIAKTCETRLESIKN